MASIPNILDISRNYMIYINMYVCVCKFYSGIRLLFRELKIACEAYLVMCQSQGCMDWKVIMTL